MDRVSRIATARPAARIICWRNNHSLTTARARWGDRGFNHSLTTARSPQAVSA